MRKEGIVVVVAGWILVSVLLSAEQLVNAFLMFIMAGVVPGTQFAFSSGVMLFLSVVSMLLLSLHMSRQNITEALKRYKSTQSSRYFDRKRFKQVKIS